MSRRSLALLLALVAALGLSMSAAVAQVPYVGLGAGPTYDTLGMVDGTPVISIAGRRTYPTTGHLDLTTVGVLPELTLLEALEGWLDPDLAVVPRDVVYPPDRSEDEIDEANAASMQLSQDAATTAALRQLGIPVATEVVVHAVTPRAPADGRLRPGDVITSVDGTAVRDSAALRDRVSARRPGAPVVLGYTRGGKPASTRLTAGRAPDVDRAIIGVEPRDRADYPFEVTIRLKEVGGPSAGLMFALGIIDKLEPQALTGGRYVAGTGEIRPDGVVGPIGGIAQKLLGARESGAAFFLTPAGNCREAAEVVPEGLQLVRVATLADALEGLRAVREGAPVRGCTSATSSAAG
ncbi:MAG: PDZ domain-containing protein [Actinomycetota bacterium]|nr:PDZ domain-containing protein [Actinomycetota bacterium]